MDNEREIVLDTETTGFDPDSGDKIVEIGAVEIINYLPTGKTYHQYINPQRSMPAGAFAVHGLGDEFLADKPIFTDIAQAFIDFIGDSPLVIHNASFDMKFLNAELRWANLKEIPYKQAIDTLDIARRKFPGAQNSLDALCRRFHIDNSRRTKHGALLDSEILAEVYLELMGGRQRGMSLSSNQDKNTEAEEVIVRSTVKQRTKVLPSRISHEEKAAHDLMKEKLGEDALWNLV